MVRPGPLYKNELDVILDSDTQILDKLGAECPPETALDLAYVLQFKPHIWHAAARRWANSLCWRFTITGKRKRLDQQCQDLPWLARLERHYAKAK